MSANIFYSDDLVSYIKELAEISQALEESQILHNEPDGYGDGSHKSCEISVSGWSKDLSPVELAAAETIVWDE